MSAKPTRAGAIHVPVGHVSCHYCTRIVPYEETESGWFGERYCDHPECREWWL